MRWWGSGNEIRSVIMHGDRFERFPIGKIDGTLTWQVGEKVPMLPQTSTVERSCCSHSLEQRGCCKLHECSPRL